MKKFILALAFVMFASVSAQDQKPDIFLAHDIFMSRYNALRVYVNPQDSHGAVMYLNNLKNEMQSCLSSCDISEEYTQAVIALINSNIAFLDGLMLIRQSPNYDRLTTEDRMRILQEAILFLISRYDAFNVVCEKYNLKNLNALNG